MAPLILAAIAIVAIEFSIFLIVRIQRRSFPWLVTKADEYPVHTPDVIRKFVSNSHDADLGWVRKPNSQGTEKGSKGEVRYEINSLGARAIPWELESKIAAFGDSYVFGRQVEDEETWPAQLSHMTSRGVLNFGVGNYGADQALIRYEKTYLPDSVEHVVLGFVPETISRIHSSWKHYLEFGNTLAFKPRFSLMPDGGLLKIDNLVRKAEDFFVLPSLIPQLQKNDFFYKKKFRSFQFRFPYLLSFLRHPFYNSILISALGFRAFARFLGFSDPSIESRPFSIVMSRNIRDAHQYYADPKAQQLLTEILRRFVEEAGKRGHRPLILVMPQLLDLKNADIHTPHRAYFAKLAETLPLLDLTDLFSSADVQSCYVNDQYGGHFSAAGNFRVASRLAQYYRQESESQR